MDRITCIICKNRIQSHAFYMKCSICEKYAHIQCISFTREDCSKNQNWTCSLCNQYLFPFHNLDTDLLKNALISDCLSSNDLSLDLYANKIFNPFNFNEIDTNEPNFDIDPDMNYFNEFGHNLSINCNYYTEELCNQLFRKEKDDCIPFSIFHHNIRSLPANYNQLNVLLDTIDHSFSIMGLSETWLDCEKYDLYQFQGYNHIGKTRCTQRGGGVSLFIKDCYSFKERTDLSKFDDTFESLFIEIHKSFTGHKKDIIIGLVYRPPNRDVSQFSHDIGIVLETITRENKFCYILGDFNLDLLNCESHQYTKDFLDLLYSNSFVPLINRPTRITSTTATLIDNIFTNNHQDIALSKQGIIPCHISDHFPIFHVDKISVTKNKDKKRNIRMINSSNKQNFIRKINENDWSDIYQSTDTQSAYSKFSHCFTKIYNESFPIRAVSTTYHNKLPWLTDGLRESIKHKNKLYRISLRRPYLQYKLEYKRYHNKLNHLIRISEKKYFQSLFERYKQNSTKTWSIIRDLIWKSKSSNANSQFYDSNGNIITDPSVISDMFNSFFVNVGKTLARKIPPPRKNPEFFLEGDYPNSNCMQLFPSTDTEVLKILQCFKDGAAGYDDLSPKQVKLVSASIASPLSYVMNLSISQGVFPKELKTAKVSPIFKAGDALLVNNYRPISVLPVFSKLFERIMYNRLFEYLDVTKILYSHQYGFRKGFSTYMALVTLIDNLSTALENGEYAIGVFLDFSKAFDTVDHAILLKKLDHYGIRGTALKWFEDYLHCRTQFVTYNGYKSNQLNVTCGVPQGSILGPLLFLIYINDLPNAAPSLFSILYADDTDMFMSSKDFSELQNVVNENLASISDWLQANRLSINVKKTNIMIWTPKSKSLPNIDIKMDGQSIDVVNEIKFLGVILDDKLSWSKHIQYISNKVSKGIGIIKKLRPVLNKSTLINLYYAFVYPFLTYCIHVWGNTHAVHLSKLTVLQKRAIRIIAGVPARSHTDPLFLQLKLLKFEHTFKLNIALFMYRYHHGLLPEVFNLLFIRNSQYHSYETRQNSMISMPHCRTDRTKRTIRYQGVHVWNRIIFLNIDVSLSIETYKYYIKKNLMEGIL